MHIELLLYITSCVASVAIAGLCDTVTIKYIIGNLTPLLDVQAEDISLLRQPCQKEITLPGARESLFRAVNAEFGYNRAYEYSELIGTSRRPVYDQIFVHFGKCSAMTTAVNVSTGLSEKFTSSSVCLYIKPEIDHRALGTHVPGGKVKLSVRVNTAVCRASWSHIDTNINGSCQPLCNGSGLLHNCKKETTRANTTSMVTTESVVATGMQIWTKQATTKSAVTTTPNLTTEIKNWNHPTSTEQITSTLHATHLRTVLTVSSVTPTHISTATTKVLKPSYVTISTLLSITGKQYITTTTNVSTPASITAPKNSGFTKAQEVPTITTKSFTDIRTNSEATATAPSSASNSHPGEGYHIFGLLEGLYVIVGCTVLLLLLGILAFLIRRRKTVSSSGGSNSGSAQRNEFHWRDNWLVRYHNNEIEGDSISQWDSDIHYIHGNFLNQSNTELHHIHHSEHADAIKNKSSESSYDNPYPLVRLDSDFVKNAKSLERERSNADKNAVDAEEHNTVETAAHGRNEEDKQDAEGNGNSKQNDKLSESRNVSQHKHHIGSPTITRGKYKVAKVERSNSKNSFKNSQILHEYKTSIRYKDQKRTKSESQLNHVESNTKKNSQHRNSSSSSEYGPTFEEMLKNEIHIIEDALDINCNVDTESNGSDRDMKKNWRVSTLYAIVSPRTGGSSKDIVLARKPSCRRQDSGINRSESYRKIDNDGTKTKQILRSSPRTTSLQSERSASQRRFRRHMELPEVPAYDSKTGASQTEYNRFNNTNDQTRSIYPDNQCSEGKASSESTRDPNESKHGDACVINKDELETVHNIQETLSTFQQNREKFEQNGSIKQDSKPNSGASGTGQFPK